MGYLPLDSLEQLTPNRYEAVLIAAQRARQLNAVRLAKLEMLKNEKYRSPLFWSAFVMYGE